MNMKSLSALLIFCVVCLVFHLNNNIAAQENPLFIATESNAPPFSDKNYFNGGYTTEIIRSALENAGYSVEFKFVPFARGFALLKDGVYAGMAALYYTDERAKTIAYTEPIAQDDQVFFQLKGRGISYQGNLHTLQSYKIGVVRSYAYSKEFEEAGFLNKIVSSSPEKNINLLLHKRIDLLIESEKVIIYLLQTKFPEQKDAMEVLAPPVKTQLLYVGFSKKHPKHKQLVADFNRRLKIIKEDGTMKNINEKYDFRH
ncbi:MAG: amino acid ABC transporter substrate-binding protein [Desulfobacteraceae bacterium]|nr:amino acid ABC transporter substrate-binding protein [Desulfobacteraceae bacterium]